MGRRLSSGKGKRVDVGFLTLIVQGPLMGHPVCILKGDREFVHVGVIEGSHAGSVHVVQRDPVAGLCPMRLHARLVAQYAVVRHGQFMPVLRIDRHHFFGCPREKSLYHR